MTQQEVRSYEVSVWTLQDDFITVLKPANIEFKGQIQDGSLELNVDGTQEFSFTIPMYLNVDGIKKENPIWYDYRDGVLLVNMRKIKVILNKGTEDEEVFEYIITKVTERHEKDELYCDVECEGLAFSELGKQGYKVSLVSDDFYDEDLKWFNKTTDVNGNILVPNEPHATLQYWLNKFLKPWPTNGGPVSPAIWYYVVDMDWGAYTVMAKKNDRSQELEILARESNKVYEEEYVVSWELTDNGLVPGNIEGYKEKERLVDLEESNIYNLTQDLAETFGIYCKYIYEHDENYRITARKIVFYNSFIEEGKGPIDINYKYNTTSISREMDGNDIVTKMFVRPVDSDVSASGLITIMDVGANKSLEDYVLNFDYLYSIGAIDEERYNYVSTYERKMREWNQELIPIGERLTALAVMLPEEEAKLATAETAVVLDKERRDKANQLYNSLVNDKGVIQVTNANPKQMYLYQEETSDRTGFDKFYISFTEKGVIGETVKIYRDIEYDITDSNGYSLITPVTTGTRVKDDFDNLVRISGIYFPSDDATRNNFVYVTYDYHPRLYYENVRRVWEQRVVKDEAELVRAKAAVEAIKLEIKNLESEQKQLIAEKEEEIENFQRMMGPALREGYWQPDDYTDYGDTHTDSFSSNAITLDTTSSGRQSFVVEGTTGFDYFIWDSGLFDDEQKLYYELGANQQRQYYYFVDLTDKMNNFRKAKDDNHNSFFYDLDNISFAFFDFVSGTSNAVRNTANMRKFTINSECFPVFVQNGNKVRFGLLLTGAEKLSSTELTCMLNSNQNAARVARYTHTVNSNNEVVYNEELLVGNVQPTPLTDSYRIVYPRVMVKSLSMKTSTDQFSLNLDGNELKVYEDYYILTKLKDNEETLYGNNNVSLTPDKDSYYITIKPESFVKYSTEAAKYGNGKIGGTLDVLFTISNADTAIYLDAVEVLKDSSQPQVSYNLNVGLVQKDYIKTVYKMLNRIVHINDPELKFRNVQGYISKVVLDLDRPWEDSIESKNYKTKFEDLFTKIIASTEQMKKSSYVSGIVSQAFTSTGELKPTVVQSSLDKSNVNYAFNSGKLTIDQSNGILATSSEGVIALRGGGLFSATEKDDDGNWKWQSILTPAGLNTSALAAGQLDTNNLRLFAGDDLRFQMNNNGIFAYKNWKSDFDLFENEEDYATVKEKWAAYGQREDVGFEADPAQYVTLNEDGLFLIADEGAMILNKEGTDYNQITERVERVAITWNGLTLRNYDNEEVFYADADTGDLNITGNITATGLNIVTKNPNDGSDIELDFDDFFEDYESNIEDFNDSLEQLGYDLFGNGGTASNPTSGGALYKLNSKTQLLQDNGHISMSALGYITSTNHGTESVETILARTANIQVNANGEISIESNEYIKNGSNNFELGSSSSIHLTPQKIEIGSTGSVDIYGGLLTWQIAVGDVGTGIQAGAYENTSLPYMYLYGGGLNNSNSNSCGLAVTPQGTLWMFAQEGGVNISLSQLPIETQAGSGDEEDDQDPNAGQEPAETNGSISPVAATNASTASKDRVIFFDAPYIVFRGNGGSSNRLFRLSAGTGAPSSKSNLNEFGSIWIDIDSSKGWKKNKWSECKIYFKQSKHLS